MTSWIFRISRNALSNVALVGLFVLGLVYLLSSVVRIDPFADPYRITLHMPHSGGLLDRSEVTYRGIEVGRVDSIRLRPDGVAVELTMDEDTQIPADSRVRVAGLSVAGEQYIDFSPRSKGGPYLADGAVISDAQTPTHFAQLLSNLTRLAQLADPDKIRLVFDELSTATSGAAPDIRTVLSGGDEMLATFEKLLPETLRILRNADTTLTTVVSLRDELRRLGSSGKVVARTLQKADPDLRALLDRSPEVLATINALLTDIRPETEAALHDLAVVGSVTAPRTDALGVLFPELAKGGDTMGALAGHDELNTLVDTWPRVNCDYGTPVRPPTEGGWPEPRLDAQCPVTHPDLQQRGAYNAPRPADDPTRQGAAPTSAPKQTAPRSKADASPAVPKLSHSESWLEIYLSSLKS